MGQRFLCYGVCCQRSPRQHGVVNHGNPHQVTSSMHMPGFLLERTLDGFNHEHISYAVEGKRKIVNFKFVGLSPY